MSDGQEDIAETALDHVATPSRPSKRRRDRIASPSRPSKAPTRPCRVPVATDNPIKPDVLDP